MAAIVQACACKLASFTQTGVARSQSEQKTQLQKARLGSCRSASHLLKSPIRVGTGVLHDSKTLPFTSAAHGHSKSYGIRAGVESEERSSSESWASDIVFERAAEKDGIEANLSPASSSDRILDSGWWLCAGAAAAAAAPMLLGACIAGMPAGSAEAAEQLSAVQQQVGLSSAFQLAPEPANALSLPTWVIHVASVVEWVTAMALVWQYGDTKGNSAWKGLAWGMVPLLAGAMCACTWHFFYNAPSLEVLVAIQGSMTLLGNCTIWMAAYRIYRQSQQASTS
eukprot:jgi/Mesen1/5060/ME000252S04175